MFLSHCQSPKWTLEELQVLLLIQRLQESVNMIFLFLMALLCLFSAAVLLIFWFVCLVRLKHACLQVYLELKFKLFLLKYVFLKI